MSDEGEEHSESEFYYPDEYEFDGDLTETNNERVGERENERNSQEEIETFVKEQKSENTTKKTVSDMRTFQRYLSSISKSDVEILDLPADDLDHYWQSFSRTSTKLMATSTSLTRYQVFSEASRGSFPMGNLHTIFLSKRNFKCHVKFYQPSGKV